MAVPRSAPRPAVSTASAPTTATASAVQCTFPAWPTPTTTRTSGSSHDRRAGTNRPANCRTITELTTAAPTRYEETSMASRVGDGEAGVVSPRTEIRLHPGVEAVWRAARCCSGVTLLRLNRSRVPPLQLRPCLACSGRPGGGAPGVAADGQGVAQVRGPVDPAARRARLLGGRWRGERREHHGERGHLDVVGCAPGDPDVGHSGMFPCLRAGPASRLVASVRSARAT